VLEVSTRPYDERFPQMCMDESDKQLIADKLEGLTMQPGQPERSDDSYEQGPMLTLFLACEPLTGKRMVKVTEQKTSKDRAHFMQEVIDVHYPNAEKIVLVMDTLATHSPAAFYHAFPPGEARRLAAKLEIDQYPVAWQLADYGRDRMRGPGSSMPLASHRDGGRARTSGGVLARAAQHRCNHRELALHHC
jgi:hypothetical protein